jgi:hypothetical protein
MFILWPNGRKKPYWHGINAPHAGMICGQSTPDGAYVCCRHRDHLNDPAARRPGLHLAFMPVGGHLENVAEWLEGDRNVPEYWDRDDIQIPPSPTLPSSPCPPPAMTKPCPPDPPALISRDRQTAVFYGEVYELDLIPDATNEDYRNLPTLEQLNKMRRG